MGGNSVDEDWELASSSQEVRTLVLVGRTGNGKNATGNSVLGEKVFVSEAGSSGVTSVCEMHSAELNDGQIVNVIDTPGLFDNSTSFELLGNEIVKCIDLAKDGIHAILLVFSFRTRFTKEEVAALHSLKTLFGSEIVDYMIVVFTGGDELEFNDQTLEDYLGSKCSEPLKEVLTLCKNRCVLFDNRTKDEKKQYGQRQQLLSFVNMVISQNGGQPYTNEYFTELKKNQQREAESLKGLSKVEISEMKMQLQLAHEEQLRKIVEMVVVDLREATKRLEKQLDEEKAARLEAEENAKKQLAEEKDARLKAEENAKSVQSKSEDEIRKLKEDLKKAEEELGKRGCVIL